MKKRVIALMLAFVLVLNMGTVAFANGEATPAPVTETEPTPTQEVEATLTPAPIAEAPSPVAEVIPTPTSEVVLGSISVTQTPDKLEYLCTDTVVDSTGGLLTLTFSDRTTQTVDLSVATLSLVKEAVNVTYEDMTDSFAVTVTHSYDEGVVTTEATATEPGVMTYTCADCGDEQIGEIPMAVATEIASGTCGAEGDNLTWTLDSDGVLTISGTGDMAYYSASNEAPWAEHRETITEIVLPEGITSIGDYAFADCSKVKEVIIPDSVISIYGGAFANCTELAYLRIPKSVKYITNTRDDGTNWNILDNYLHGCSKLITAGPIGSSCNIEYGWNIEIPHEAFWNCGNLESLHIASGITKIAEMAIYNNVNLESITVDESNTEYDSIDGVLFTKDGKTLIKYPENKSGTQYSVPTGTITIGENAFNNCDNLTKVTLNEGLTQISQAAFSDCSALSEMIIPDGVTNVGACSFYGCSALKSIVIPASVTVVASQSFGRCTALEGITIPASVTDIRECAFEYCSALIKITFEGNAPTTIETTAFNGVTATAYYDKTKNWAEDDFQDYGGNITWKPVVEAIASGICGAEGDNLTWTLDSDGILTISGTGAMADYAFDNSNSTSTITTPWYIYKSNIKSIVIGDGVTSIGNHAFYDCRDAIGITIPDSVASIGDMAFASCGRLTSIAVPNGIASIGEGAFYYCTGLESIAIPNSVTVIGDYAFRECSNLTSITMPNNIASIGEGIFYRCNSLTDVAIPSSVKSIGDFAFNCCNSLTSIDIPSGVKNIGKEVFLGCSELSSVTMPDSITSLGDYAFDSCVGLTNITIPSSVTNIGYGTFYDCTSLNNVIFACDAPEIRDNAFTNVTATVKYPHTKNWPEDKLQDYGGTITWKAIAETVASGTCGAEGDNLTWTLDSDGVLTISGTGAMKDYPNEIGAPWADFADDLTKVVIEEGITTIGASAFMYCDNLTEVVIPGTVTSIGSTAFLGCNSLTKFDIPEGVISVGGEAFGECNALERINIPSSLTSFGERMFMNGAGKLTEINVDSGNTVYSSKEGVLYSKDGSTLVCYPCGKEDSSYIVPEGVTAIGNSAFEDCNVTQVQLPDTLTRICAHAFMNCPSLKTVNIPNGVSTIESGAFSCGITSISIPASVTEMESAFTESYALTEINVDSSNPNYMSKDGVLFNKDGKELICYPDQKTDIEYTVSDGVVAIKDGAFADTRNLKKVTIPGNVKIIEKYAFSNMIDSLEEVVLSEGLAVIDDGAFSWCGGLTSITIPASVTKIGERAFIESGLTGISFKGDALQIADNAFTNVTATVKYLHTKNWPEDKLQDYGGTLTWQLCCENFEECEVIKDKAVEPTFDSTGLTEGSHCSVCEKPIVAQNELPKLAVTELEITAPDKLVYYKGESLDSTGLTVTAKLNNDTNIDVTDQVQLEGFSSNAAGTKTITVSFKDAQATFDVQVFSFTSVSLSLEGRVIINFYANFPDYAEAGYTPGILFFRKQPDGDEIVAAYNAGEGVTSYVVADNGALMFSYDKLAAKELNDKVYATLYAVQDDGKVVFGTPTPISAAEYAISTFGLYANDARLQTLMVDMLNFGAAAQNEFDYRTKALANSNMSATMAAKATKDNVSLSNGMKLYKDGLSSDKVTIKSASLSLDNEISINFYAEIKGDIKKAELLIFDEYTAGGVYDKNTASKRTDMVPHEDMYAGFITGIAAKSMRDLYYARVYVQFEDGTEAYSGIGQYSVESYAWQVRNGSGFSSELKLLMEEMMKYGDSAKMYMENKNNNANG